jgi:hypothetical protein
MSKEKQIIVEMHENERINKLLNQNMKYEYRLTEKLSLLVDNEGDLMDRAFVSLKKKDIQDKLDEGYSFSPRGTFPVGVFMEKEPKAVEITASGGYLERSQINLLLKLAKESSEFDYGARSIKTNRVLYHFTKPDGGLVGVSEKGKEIVITKENKAYYFTADLDHINELRYAISKKIEEKLKNTKLI